MISDTGHFWGKTNNSNNSEDSNNSNDSGRISNICGNLLADAEYCYNTVLKFYAHTTDHTTQSSTSPSASTLNTNANTNTNTAHHTVIKAK